MYIYREREIHIYIYIYVHYCIICIKSHYIGLAGEAGQRRRQQLLQRPALTDLERFLLLLLLLLLLLIIIIILVLSLSSFVIMIIVIIMRTLLFIDYSCLCYFRGP